jgi:hypothetical protein
LLAMMRDENGVTVQCELPDGVDWYVTTRADGVRVTLLSERLTQAEREEAIWQAEHH